MFQLQFQQHLPLSSNESHADTVCAATALYKQCQSCPHLSGLNDATEYVQMELGLLGENGACPLM